MISFKEKPNANVGKRVRAVGMCFFWNKDLIMGEQYSLRRNYKNPKDKNCIEIKEGGISKAVVNRNIAALLAPLIDAGKIAQIEW